MKYFYPAVFTDDKETNLFHMTFPDLAGCGATAETVEETLRKAREALGTSLWELEEKKIPPPPPSEEQMCIRDRSAYHAGQEIGTARVGAKSKMCIRDRYGHGGGIFTRPV